jgi:hypothetical protein
MSRVCIPIPTSTYISSGSGTGTGGGGGGGSVAPTVPTVNILRTESGITSLTGGTSSALNGIATNNSSAYPVNICVFLPSLNPPTLYQLKAGTDAENIPFVVRPTDYGASNQKVWIQRL